MSSAPNTRDIDHELRRVDDAFARLRPGKELDERLDDLLDGRAAPTRSIAPRATIAMTAIAIGAVAIALFALRDTTTLAVTPAPVVVEKAPERIAIAPVERVAPVAPVALEEDVRFIAVPMGQLEVRAPSTVDVRNGRAIVTSGSVRLFERGKAPRTLLKGQSIAWKLPSSEATRASDAMNGIDDAAIETMLAHARAHEARGAYAAAADVLADLLAKKPPPRVADTVGFERASLLSRARNVTDACAALDVHARKFPASENAADVTALRARLRCH